MKPIGEVVNGIVLREHMGLIWSVVHKHRWGLCVALDADDLAQAGFLGLRRAALKFEPERGYKFSTYALHWVRQSIRRCILDQKRAVRIPVWAQDAARAKGKTLPGELSLDNPVNAREPGSDTLLDRLADDDAVTGARADASERRALLDRAMAQLPERTRAILRSRFWEERTLAATGEQLGVTRERIRQIEVAALARLRDVLSADG